jgi:acetyl esterase/lipase
MMTPLARDVAEHGLAAWNLEYRRVGQEGGGWPGTLLDVAAGVDALASAPEVDTSRVVVIGHSAGGHLALWLAGRRRLPAGAPGAQPRVLPRAAVSQAGVCDLAAGARDGLGGGAVEALVGGSPSDEPDRYAVASPTALLPLGVPQLLVHGLQDVIVPPSQSRAHAAAAMEAGDAVELIELAGDHFDVVDPQHEAWRAVVERLPRLFA